MTSRATLSFVALALYLVVSVSLLRLDESIADWLVAEDGGFEALGAICLAIASLCAFLAFTRSRGENGVKRASLLGLTLILFVAAGEEISWGQRLLGVETPAALRGINSQGETNLHNLYGDDNGQNASHLVFQAFWISFGVVIPLLATYKPLGRVLRRYLPVLPLWLGMLFIGQQLLWKPVQANFRSDPGAWNTTHRPAIDDGPPFRVETRVEAQARGVSSPGGLSEVMEANIQVLLAAAGFCVFMRVGHSGGGRRKPVALPNRADVLLVPVEERLDETHGVAA